jgi:hypothetical protein
VSVFPCSNCHARKPGKFAALYWAWFLADQSRSAWKQRLCPDCFISNFREMFGNAIENEETCPICHTLPGDTVDPIYVTVYIPKKEPAELVLPTCATCAVPVRNAASQGAQRLVDRGAGVRGPSTSQALTSAWDAIGLEPA